MPRIVVRLTWLSITFVIDERVVISSMPPVTVQPSTIVGPACSAPTPEPRS